MACNYNCSEPPPWSPNNDISGIGVVISYIVTAGMAVLIIFLHYVTLYQPADEPFSVTGELQRRLRPNAVDEMMLGCLRRAVKRMTGISRLHQGIAARINRMFLKCILSMSDLQIVTGFSILISGLLQLRCGLTTFYLQLVVYLAWFSTITHLSCLTLLRNHLYNHIAERKLRLFAMAVLATMLIIGLLFTANYDWEFSNDQGAVVEMEDLAICHLRINPTSSLALWTMLVSVLMIFMAFVSRVVKLHRRLSIDILGGTRAWLSALARKMLRIVYVWCGMGNSPRSLKHALCYRPLLAIFLAVRFLTDGWCSMFFEVFWLILAFSWGIYRLMETIYVAKFWRLPTGFDDGSGNWTFGQVVAIVLLVAPLITVVESYNSDFKLDGSSASNSEFNEPFSSNLQLTNASVALSDNVSHMDTTTKYAEDPDNDWKCHYQTLGVAALYVLALFVGWGSMLTFGGLDSPSLLTLLFDVGRRTIAGLFLLAFVGFLGLILFSLMIETYLQKQRLRVQISLQALNLVFFAASYILVAFPRAMCPPNGQIPFCYYGRRFFWNPDRYGFGLYWNPDVYGFGLYVMCVCVYRFLI